VALGGVWRDTSRENVVCPLFFQKSDTLSTYSIDPSNGALKPIGKYPTGKGSNWVEIVSFE
jgi:6-phosphogluconolactonase (cycloisomerase 2 family)